MMIRKMAAVGLVASSLLLATAPAFAACGPIEDRFTAAIQDAAVLLDDVNAHRVDWKSVSITDENRGAYALVKVATEQIMPPLRTYLDSVEEPQRLAGLCLAGDIRQYDDAQQAKFQAAIDAAAALDLPARTYLAAVAALPASK